MLALFRPLTRRLLDDDEGLDPRQLSARSSQAMHDVGGGHHGLQRGDAGAAATSAGGEVGGEETDNGKTRSKATGGGGASLEKEPTALLSAANHSEGGAAGAGAGEAGGGNDQKSGGGKHNLKKTAARLAVKISETSMVRRGGNAQLFLAFVHEPFAYVLLGSISTSNVLKEVTRLLRLLAGMFTREG